MPVYQSMVKNGVTIFRHDMYTRRVPNLADENISAFNRDAYRSGDVLPNAVCVLPYPCWIGGCAARISRSEMGEVKGGSYTLRRASVRT